MQQGPLAEIPIIWSRIDPSSKGGAGKSSKTPE